MTNLALQLSTGNASKFYICCSKSMLQMGVKIVLYIYFSPFVCPPVPFECECVKFYDI
jgi:hypothetical protein